MARSCPNRLVWLLVAVLIGAKALVPSGWMPVAAADGVRIALCTGQGPVIATIDASGHVHKYGQKDGAPQAPARETCPFATLALTTPLPASPVLAPAAPVRPAPVHLAQPRSLAPAHAPRPPARGPPLFA
jgi:hypothetical protein